MKLIKSKYIKILSIIICLFFISDKVNAKQITCKYTVSGDIPYNELTVVYSSDRSEMAVESKEWSSAKYVAYYQFDDGVKGFLNELYADKTETSLWSEDTNYYFNFIPIDTWIENGCLEHIDILYDDNKTSFGFSASSTAYQSKFNYMRNSRRMNLSYSSEKGQVYTVTISANESTYWKVYDLFEGELVPEPLESETGLPKTQDGKPLCWQTQEARCWDFSKPVTSDLSLNAVYLYSEDNSVGFKNNLDKKYIQCNGAEIPYGVPYIIYRIINLIKVATPIILIVMGMLDFVKATIAGDERQMKDSTGRFIKRIIAAVIIFFVVVVIQFIFKQIGEKGEEALGCISCFVSGECSPYEAND